MEYDKKYVYAKFTIDSKLKLMQKFIISEDRDTVDKWPDTRPDKSKPKQEAEAKRLQSFEKVGADFESAIGVFQETVPVIMRDLSLTRKIIDDSAVNS
jgi:hypothetical protein